MTNQNPSVLLSRPIGDVCHVTTLQSVSRSSYFLRPKSNWASYWVFVLTAYALTKYPFKTHMLTYQGDYRALKYWSESLSISKPCICEQRRLWRDCICADWDESSSLGNMICTKNIKCSLKIVALFRTDFFCVTSDLWVHDPRSKSRMPFIFLTYAEISATIYWKASMFGQLMPFMTGFDLTVSVSSIHAQRWD